MSTTEIAPVTTPPSADKSKRRKAKAILAGGLVLGIGAAVTLAAWNDSEFVIGTFGGGHFNLVGTNAQGEDFSDHDAVGSGADLAFELEAENLAPEQTIAAPYAVRLDAATNYDATISLGSAQGAGVAKSKFKYKVFTVSGWSDCTPEAAPATGREIVADPTSLDAVPANAGTVELKKFTTETDPEATVYFCFQVTADGTLEQTDTAVGTWKLVAESKPAT
jgi:predicted ribosomally synthesized peptide with SipW-like signal peptide